MPQDHEITKELWEGKIPVEFVLAENDLPVLEKPKPYYVLVSRVSYFPLVLEKVLKHFLASVPGEETGVEPWVDYEGQALQWHHPIGVLFDLLKVDDSLPWQITVHFKDFPTEEIVQFPHRDAVEASFIQSLKEADQLKHRAAVINAMPKREHKQLWNGLVSDRYDQFWSVNRKLMGNSQEDPLLLIPLRIYQRDKPYIQNSFAPFNAEGERLTLADAFETLNISERTALTHGVQIPLETPLLWLCENMAYPDNFVHVISL